MPINLLSLPIADLQYALTCMDLFDLIAFSLCSKRTKNLVKDSKIEIEPILVDVRENRIRFGFVQTWIFQETKCCALTFWDFFDSYIVNCKYKIEVSRKQGFTQSDWIAHFMSVFHGLIVTELSMNDTVSASRLDTIKEIIPKCHKLSISPNCSDDVAKIAFRKLSPIIKEVEIEKNIFDSENDISKFLTPNLRSLSLIDEENPFKLTSVDLLAVNITDLSIEPANITEKELNRFLKLWMKRNHAFYRPKFIRLTLVEEIQLNRQPVDFECLLKRGDGKELLILVSSKSVIFEFRV